MATPFRVLEELQNANKRMAQLEGRQEYLTSLMRGLLDRGQVRETANKIFEVNTNDHTREKPATFDAVNEFNGPANSFLVLDVGGGNLELNINGGGWFAAGKGDHLKDFAVERIQARVTTAAAGNARIWVGAFSPRKVA